MTSQIRHHYVQVWHILQFFSVTQIVWMICVKNYEKLSKFVKVTAKISGTVGPFFQDTVYMCSFM